NPKQIPIPKSQGPKQQPCRFGFWDSGFEIVSDFGIRISDFPPQEGVMRAGGYFASARHPWAWALFVLPLLAAYEVGMLLEGPGQQEYCRNGADLWLRELLGSTGLGHGSWAPALLAAGLLAWAWRRRKDRPRELGPVWLGMVLESAVLAVGLWG